MWEELLNRPPKLLKFAGWEGGLAPAQDAMPLNIRIDPSRSPNLQVRKLELLIED
jgi:hypothetical protein